jgi:MFS family permease
MEDVEKRVIGKVMRRLIPFLILCYFVAYLDRVNVSFAKLHMNQALGFSDAAFGLGAGLFFIAYFLFEVPSNIFLERVGARLWIARIMISMGDRLSCVRLYSIDRQLEFRTKGFSIPFVCYSAHSRPVSSRVSSSI